MNSDAVNQTYGFIVTKSFHVLYLICSSLEFCESVRLMFISIIYGRNCDSEKLTNITLQACHGVFFLTNSPGLFTLCCQYQTIGKYSTVRSPKLCLKIQHCSQIVHDSWKDETIWGSSLDSTPEAHTKLDVHLLVAMDQRNCVSNIKCTILCDCFTSFLAFPELQLTYWKGLPSN